MSVVTIWGLSFQEANMSIAVGGSWKPEACLSPLCISVTDHGAVADGNTDCSPAFEAAYAALIAKLNSKGNNTYEGLRGYIRWPAATLPYAISRPMKIEDPFIYVVGDGPGSRIQTNNGNSAVIFGLRTTEPYAGGTLALRNAISSLAMPHTINAATLTVHAGDGPLFGTPTPSYPTRLVVTDPTSGNISIYAAVGRSGDTFTLQQTGTNLTLYDTNATDNAFSAGARVESVHRPDIFGKVDTTFAPAAATRYGLRLNGDGTVFFQASPLSLGQLEPDNQTLNNWSSTSTLTLEFCVEAVNGKAFLEGGVVFSMGVYSNPSPMALTISGNPNAFDFAFKTADGVVHSVEFGAGASATGPLKMAVQVDLGARTVLAFANGIQVAVTPSDSFFTGGLPTTFARNEYATLLFGNAYTDTRPITSTGGWASYDLRLYGFSLSGRLRYKNAGVGLAQQRVDNGVLNDAYRYASGDFSDTNIIGYLPMTDVPSTNRLVTSRVLGNNNASGYFVQNAMFSQVGGLLDNGLTDLHLIGPGFGAVVVIGNALDLTIERCTIENGTHAIGTLNLTANYVLQLRDCSLSGSDAGYYGAWQLAEVSNLRFQTCGRAPIRLWASDVFIDGVFMTDFGSTYTESVIKMHAGLYGGSYRFENVTVDFEGEGLAVAPIYLEQHPTSAAVTSCIVKNFYIGTIGNAVAYVQVKTMPFDSIHYVQLDVDNFQCGGTTNGVILDIDGPAVTGEVKNVFLANQPPINHRQTYGTSCNVVILDTTRKAPPRSFGWYPGAHVLEVRSAADGQFAEWRCMAAGTYGTPTPPQWVGINSLSLTTSSLASYVLNHAYMTATLS
jgi:hypothetical protein